MFLKVLQRLKSYARFIFYLARIVQEDFRKAVRYLSLSRTLRTDTEQRLRGALIANYHVIEKGLVMPNRRKIFGESVALDLLSALEIWLRRGYEPDVQVRAAARALTEYVSAVESKVCSDMESSEFWPAIVELSVDSITSSTRTVVFPSPGDFSMLPYESLLNLRCSVRDFSDADIELRLLENAVQTATATPSVCNRQSFKAHLFTKSDDIQCLLELQNGNRGFGHLAKGLFVITADLSSFYGVDERNQCFLDGGLFGMNLMLSLLNQGVVSCPLNWCQSQAQSERLRRQSGICSNEEILMLLAVGMPKATCTVPSSQKFDLSEVLCHHV